jgi:hypothetical protein
VLRAGRGEGKRERIEERKSSPRGRWKRGEREERRGKLLRGKKKLRRRGSEGAHEPGWGGPRAGPTIDCSLSFASN